jgi:hypothetical protein
MILLDEIEDSLEGEKMSGVCLCGHGKLVQKISVALEPLGQAARRL